MECSYKASDRINLERPSHHGLATCDNIQEAQSSRDGQEEAASPMGRGASSHAQKSPHHKRVKDDVTLLEGNLEKK